MQLQEKKYPWGKEMLKILDKNSIDIEQMKFSSKKEILECKLRTEILP